MNVREAGRNVEREERTAFPDLRVPARSDMGVEAGDLEVVRILDLQDAAQVAVPDAEAGGRTADVRPVVVTRTEARVRAEGHLASREAHAKVEKLPKRTGVEAHALGQERTEVLGRLLCRQENMGGGDAGAEGPVDLEPRAGVDLHAGPVQHSDDRPGGQGLHRIACRQPVWIREIEGLTRILFQRPLVVYEDRRPEAVLYFPDLRLSQERKRIQFVLPDCGPRRACRPSDGSTSPWGGSISLPFASESVNPAGGRLRCPPQQKRLPSGSRRSRSLWCERGDSNPHGQEEPTRS